MTSTDGRPVEVLYKGQFNPDAGPDFRGALLKIGGRLLRGDVEIHLHQSAWYEHGHHRDPRYNSVILHAVVGLDEETRRTVREDGVNVAVVVLNAFLPEPAPKRAATAFSAKPDINSLPCLLKRYEEARRVDIIEAQGQARLQMKAERFREERHSRSWDQLIYSGTLEALGYEKNQKPFRKLAEQIPIDVLLGEIAFQPQEKARRILQALLFGGAGLLPSQSTRPREAALDWVTLDYTAPLELLWQGLAQKLKLEAMAPEEWTFFRLRPANFPTRRLAAASQLLLRFAEQGLMNTLLRTFGGLKRDYRHLTRELELLFVCPAQGYWQDHYRFEEARLAKQESHLIGRDRARDLVVNLVLPVMLLYAQETDDGELASEVREVYRHFPKLSENSITREMRAHLFGSQGNALIHTACRQQGLIHIYKLSCRAARCGEASMFERPT